MAEFGGHALALALGAMAGLFVVLIGEALVAERRVRQHVAARERVTPQEPVEPPPL